MRTNRIYFQKTHIVVSFFVVLYSFFYFYFGVSGLALALLGLLLVSNLLIYFCHKNNRLIAARFVFIYSSLLCVLITPIWLGYSFRVECYYIAGLFLPLVLFEVEQKKEILIAMVSCFIMMILQFIGQHISKNELLLPPDFPQNFIRLANAIGAALLAFLFVKHFMQKIAWDRAITLSLQKQGEIGAWELDTKTLKTLWTPQVYEIYGLDIKIATDKDKGVSYYAPHERERISKAVENCLTSGTAFDDRFEFIDAKGKHKWIRATGQAVRGSDGNIEKIVGTFQDISYLVAAEEAAKNDRAKLVHTAKLASLGEMSAAIAHEINNPLAIISGTIEGFERESSFSPELKRKAETIQKAILRISKIVSGLRKFSRTTIKKDYKKVSLHKILSEVVDLTSVRAKRYGVQIIYENTKDFQIECDELDIEQAFVNLINNGIDAVQSLDDKWVKITVAIENQITSVFIEDSGDGLPKHVQEKLFLPFFTTKEVGQGTGLGLSIVKGILDDHKATIQLEADHPNTCFRVGFISAAT